MKNLQTWLQINDYPERYKERLLWLVKIFITGMCIWFVTDQIKVTDFSPATLFLNGNKLIWLITMVMLMPINWLLEVQKWKLSIPAERLTFSQSLTAVLSGLAMNWVLPFTLGDVSGRLAMVRNYKKSGVALLALRAISLSLTLLYGGYSVLFYFGYPIPLFGLIVLGFGVILWLIGQFYVVEKSLFASIVALSIARYFVFTAQFVIIIWVFIPELSLPVIVVGVGWVFLFRSVLPSLFGNFGVREASALIFFERYLDDPSLIIFPCIVIWLINTVVPSLVGAAYIFKLKFNIAR